MKNRTLALAMAIALTSLSALAQCSVSGITSPNGTNTSATTCVCQTVGQTNCDLRPDVMISWAGLQNYASGPSEYPQVCSGGCSGNDGRLRVTGATPNIGRGPLNFRGVDKDGKRWFICGTDTFSITDPNSTSTFTCPNNGLTKQLVVQRVYKKVGNSMQFYERFAGTMTYHPSHGHNHVDDWVTFSLRLEIPGEPNPLNWPIVGTGAKVGFCLMDYYSCTSGSAPGHCRDNHLYNQGTQLNTTAQFPNFGLGGQAYNCSPVSQGISSGWEDVYSESLDGMWINIPPGTCNGSYWIVAQVDPLNNFVEENENNNWTAIPFTLTQQSPANSGGTCGITTDRDPVICSGESVTLTCQNAGYSYLWSTGATTRSITVTQPGNYTVSVTNPCGTMTSVPFAVTVLNAGTPSTTGATLPAPGAATVSATGTSVKWFDAQVGGNQVGTGNNFTTPTLSQTTTYWAESSAIQTGITAYVGKPTNTGSGGYSNNDEYLVFDAHKELTIKSVRVYTTTAGNRTFQVLAEDGSFIAQTTAYVNTGNTRVTLNLPVPQGMNMRLYVTNTLRSLYRNSSSSGVNFPYTIPNVVTIKTSSVGVAAYPYCYDWEVSTADKVCSSTRVAATVTVGSLLPLDLKAVLEGPYDQLSGLMRDDLRAQGLLPLTEPYTALGFTQAGGGGGETTTTGVLATTGNGAPVDWVLVELRSSTDPTTIVATRAGLLLRNGTIIGSGGGALVLNAPAGDYHVAVRHRNHLGVMTSLPVTLSTTTTSLDLSSASTATWGTDARKSMGAVQALWSGNALLNNLIKYTGSANDRDPILNAIGGVVPTNTVNGYMAMDNNMDGVVKYTGAANDRDLVLTNIGGVVPTNTRTEQLP
ncbi:MAG: hypothetical protein JNL05_03300 [Flavobacteriales bacterium]|nr:hypothetical protein [Flavobacteriales bacterium]